MELLDNLKDKAEEKLHEVTAHLKENLEEAEHIADAFAEGVQDKAEEVADHLKANLEEAEHIAEAFAEGAQEKAEPYLEAYIESKQQNGSNDITK